MSSPVTAPVVPMSELLTAGQSGFVSESYLVENPSNPRLYFDPVELAELIESIKTGKQREVVTVRELREHEYKLYPGALYMVVSGARRLRAVRAARITHVEVRVKAYADEAAEELDAYVLNEGRVGLSDYEKMHKLRHLAEIHGWKTDQETARHTGESAVKIGKWRTVEAEASDRIQELMHPSLPHKKRLRLDVALTLTRFSLPEQDEIIEKMPKSLESVAAQVVWLKKEAARRAIIIPTRQRNPREIRRLVHVLASVVSRKAEAMLAVDFSRLNENAKRGELLKLIREVHEAQERLASLQLRVQAVIDGAPTTAAAVSTRTNETPERQVAARPVAASTPSVSTRSTTSNVPTAATRHAQTPLVVARRAAAPLRTLIPERHHDPPAQKTTTSTMHTSTITCNAWNPQQNRITLQTFTPAQYKDAAQRGDIEYQQKKRPRPDWLPDPDTL